MKYAIIDVETTGLKPSAERLTEIAIFVHNGKQLVDSFESLIDPEIPIPPMITRLTGISNDMVENAPRFYEIAKKIIEITEDCIFVAHSASFDYNFITEEFKRLGYSYEREKLCTVQLSRKLLPSFRSYSLGNLCQSLDIRIEGRHRAGGDAFATVKLFEILLSKDPNLSAWKTKGRSKAYNGKLKEQVDKLPEKTGVYYFRDKDGKIIYIGKSNNIRNRILQHLNNKQYKRAIEMKERIEFIDYELTGSELIALLLESDEIKKHIPLYNRSQRRKAMSLGLQSFLDDNGYLQFKVASLDNIESPHTCYSSRKEARENIESLSEKYQLCQKLTGQYKSSGSCFNYQIKQCNGACIGEESAEVYNARVEKALENFEYRHQDFVIVDKGRDEDEFSIVVIDKGKYLGFGYVEAQVLEQAPEELRHFVNSRIDHRDVKQIIRSHLKHKKVIKVLCY